MKILIALVLGFCICAAHAQDTAFHEAVASYRQGRWADSFGPFADLASKGDPDAARIALFMHRNGPILFGTYWDATKEEQSAWQQVAATARGRAEPVFVPLVPGNKPAATAQRRVRGPDVRSVATAPR